MGLAPGEEMAQRSEVIPVVMTAWRGLCAAVLAFLLFGIAQASVASAAPSNIVITGSEWATGTINVSYTGATPGNTISIYTMKWNETGFTLHDSWVAQASTETHSLKYLENGQTIWFFLRHTDPNTGEFTQSNTERQTPPITAYVINWPDMWGDMLGGLEDLNRSLIQTVQTENDRLIQSMKDLATPSPAAINELTSAVNGLKNSLGISQVEVIGGQLQNGFDGIKAGSSAPIVNDDGIGTYTGGSTGGQMPFDLQQPSGSGMTLSGPNPDSGTDTELTMRIPYTVDMNGNLIYMKIFTKEQMEKMKWLAVVRGVAIAAMYILFAIWLVTRFSPQLKS